jgi:hypothetical protein
MRSSTEGKNSIVRSQYLLCNETIIIAPSRPTVLMFGNYIYASCWFLAWLILHYWRWRRHILPKYVNSFCVKYKYSYIHCNEVLFLENLADYRASIYYQWFRSWMYVILFGNPDGYMLLWSSIWMNPMEDRSIGTISEYNWLGAIFALFLLLGFMFVYLYMCKEGIRYIFLLSCRFLCSTDISIDNFLFPCYIYVYLFLILDYRYWTLHIL